MTRAEIAARQALLEATEAFAEKIRAELAEAGVRPAAQPESADVLRIVEVAQDYDVTEKTARRWAKARGFKRGGVWFIPRDAIERRP